MPFTTNLSNLPPGVTPNMIPGNGPEDEPEEKTYRVNEVFESIQGEGAHVGRVMLFVRFAGCNLACDFCDTRHEDVNWKGIAEELVDEISCHRRVTTNRVCLTGGEPFLQIDDSLCEYILRQGSCGVSTLHIETNGTVPIPWWMAHDHRFWVTMSPKSMDIPTVNWLRCHELKVVWPGPVDPEDLTVCPSFGFIQPCWVDDVAGQQRNVALAVAKVKKLSGWRLSYQMHKYLNLR